MMVKIVVVVFRGAGALAHSLSKSKAGLAMFGALGARASVANLVLGIFLVGGGGGGDLRHL